MKFFWGIVGFIIIIIVSGVFTWGISRNIFFGKDDLVWSEEQGKNYFTGEDNSVPVYDEKLIERLNQEGGIKLRQARGQIVLPK